MPRPTPRWLHWFGFWRKGELHYVITDSDKLADHVRARGGQVGKVNNAPMPTLYERGRVLVKGGAHVHWVFGEDADAYTLEDGDNTRFDTK